MRGVGNPRRHHGGDEREAPRSTWRGTTRPATIGDSLWAFTRRQCVGLYVLAAERVVRTATHNPRNYRYGRWWIWGDLHRSRYFDVDFGPNGRTGEPHLEEIASGLRHDRLDAYLSAWIAALDEADRIAFGTPPDDVIWVPRATDADDAASTRGFGHPRTLRRAALDRGRPPYPRGRGVHASVRRAP